MTDCRASMTTEDRGAGAAAAPRRILVIRLSALGDVVQALAPIASIRAHHRDAHITALTTKAYAALLAASPYVDAVWIDDRPAAWNVRGWLALRRRLRTARFDRVYDLQTSDRTGFYFLLLGPGRRPEWSGIARGCSHPHANPNRQAMHVMDGWAEQLRIAGLPAMDVPDLAWLTADIARFDLPSRYVLLVPGGSPHRPRKIWPAENYARLARALAARGITPVVLGTAPERPLAARILAACPDARDLTGRTGFAEIAELARGAAAAVGGVTGPMHLIAMAGAPSVVLFSKISDPAQCGPRGRSVAYLRRDDLADLSVEAVANALDPMLAAR
jgi:ADP-heptose:LPS heptosyltransferase